MPPFVVPEWVQRWLMAVLFAVVFGSACFIKGCQYGNHELVAYQAKEAAESQKVAAAAITRNAVNAESWRLYARSIDERYAADKAASDARAAVASGGNAAPGVRLFDPAAQGDRNAEAGTKVAADLPVDPAAGTELSPGLVAYLTRRAGLADAAAIYAREARAVALECLARSGE